MPKPKSTPKEKKLLAGGEIKHQPATDSSLSGIDEPNNITETKESRKETEDIQPEEK